jgi:hypothetical protein
MDIVERIRSAWPSSIRTAVKTPLFRLIGLSPWAERHLDIYLSRRVFRRVHGEEPNLARPVSFSEKVTARKLFDRREIFSTLADKLLARDFAAGRIGRQFLPELYLVCDSFEEIDFDRLPDKFVIKPNHGSHWVAIVEDKKTFDKVAARRRFRRWMKTNYYTSSREFFYKNIDRKIMVEEFLQEDLGAPVIDYKFCVFDGVPKLFFVTKRQSVAGPRAACYFTRDYQQIPMQVTFANSARQAADVIASDGGSWRSAEALAFPPNMEQLFDIASKLGRGFDFIRVDLYNPGGRILFGEMTSLPNGGVLRFEPPIYDRVWGQHWNLILRDVGEGTRQRND